MIESTLDSELMATGVYNKPLVTIITYVVVDPVDPSFQSPTKPIGPVYPEEQVGSLPFPVVKGADGVRRAVASPRPVTIIEKREIQKLIDQDFIVVCCGGGGIRVVRQGGAFCGVDAVIDKDLASAKLAVEVGVDMLCIATDVPGVSLDYGTDRERFLPGMTTREAAKYTEAGQFPDGSMGPKVAAAVNFVSETRRRAVITSIEDIEKAVHGQAGTVIKQ
jgi:carbamate kinase